MSFDSTSTIKGMIFQFLVALERCFEMQEGQSMYIERFGDVSVVGKEGAIPLDDLEPMALQKAREEYKSVHPKLATEVDTWDDMELLGRAGVAVKGKLTRAAILLLGKPTSVHFLTPSVATITWVLIDGKDEKRDYEHFTIPFLLTVD